MLFLLVCLWKYYGMNHTSQSPGTICLCRGAPTCVFLYTWSRQGSCGVLPDPLLVFLIALLNLWVARDPHTSHDTRLLGRGNAKEGGFRDNRAAFVVPTCHRFPKKTAIRVQTKPRVWYCTCLSPAQTLLSQPCWQMESNGILKRINYYFRLCQNKESGDHSLVLLLLSYINWNVLFICLFCFDRDWIFNPMTKRISPRLVWFALM